jgi:hypothetical protein
VTDRDGTGGHGLPTRNSTASELPRLPPDSDSAVLSSGRAAGESQATI